MRIKIFIIALFLIVGANAQEFGVKGGLTYNAANGLVRTVDQTYENEGKGSIGYHLGIFTRINLLKFYIQPELLYSAYNSEYEIAGKGDFEVAYKRIDLPVNAGMQVFSIGRIQAGPVFSYFFEDDFDLNDVEDLQQDDFNVAMQVGAGIDIKDLSFDLRYEFPLSDRQTDFVVDNTEFQTEELPSLLHLSVGYKF